MADAAQEREHFDKLAEGTGEIWWGSTTPAATLRYTRRAQMIREQLKRFPDPKVLELGCGTGAFSRYILQEMPELRLTGCDISPKSVAVATERFSEHLNARFEVANVADAPYDTESFDAVVGNSVLHHIPLEESLRESFRVLRHGGILWFSEPNMMNPQIALEKNVRFIGRWLDNSEGETAFFRWAFAKRLRNVGFGTVRVVPFDFLHPATPKGCMRAVDALGRGLEKVPLLREICGSLHITAIKP